MSWNLVNEIALVYFPMLLGLIEVAFYRTCVTDPKIPRIAWIMCFLFFIPVLGAILAYAILLLTLSSTVFIVDGTIKLDENRKFVKKWFSNKK